MNNIELFDIYMYILYVFTRTILSWFKEYLIDKVYCTGTCFCASLPPSPQALLRTTLFGTRRNTIPSRLPSISPRLTSFKALQYLLYLTYYEVPLCVRRSRSPWYPHRSRSSVAVCTCFFGNCLELFCFVFVGVFQCAFSGVFRAGEINADYTTRWSKPFDRSP